MAITTPEINENQTTELQEKNSFNRNYVEMSDRKKSALRKLAAIELQCSDKTITRFITEKDIQEDLTQKQYTVLKTLFEVAATKLTAEFEQYVETRIKELEK